MPSVTLKGSYKREGVYIPTGCTIVGHETWHEMASEVDRKLYPSSPTASNTQTLPPNMRPTTGCQHVLPQNAPVVRHIGRQRAHVHLQRVLRQSRVQAGQGGLLLLPLPNQTTRLADPDCPDSSGGDGGGNLWGKKDNEGGCAAIRQNGSDGASRQPFRQNVSYPELNKTDPLPVRELKKRGGARAVDYRATKFYCKTTMNTQIDLVRRTIVYFDRQPCCTFQTLARASQSSGVSLPAPLPPTLSMCGNTAPRVKRSRTSSRERQKLKAWVAPRGTEEGSHYWRWKIQHLILATTTFRALWWCDDHTSSPRMYLPRNCNRSGRARGTLASYRRCVLRPRGSKTETTKSTGHPDKRDTAFAAGELEHVCRAREFRKRR